MMLARFTVEKTRLCPSRSCWLERVRNIRSAACRSSLSSRRWMRWSWRTIRASGSGSSMRGARCRARAAPHPRCRAGPLADQAW
ncbi:hypothetical protein CKO45_08965 [Paracraurococcus ruber]|uniref:Uncharacterized protein n=1 Tax=Paracraurococcus ruber TaxID=77675 RepID=A0ABS1CVC6_9PROT|nr:hypothetical protein [Paracraurococcus ruber]